MWLWLTAALAQTPTCEKVSMGQVADVQAPAVIVLGERRGIWPDDLRAQKLVARLSRNGPVTVAIQAVHRDKQPVLDQYSAARITYRDIPGLTGWNEYWHAPFSSYEGLFAVGPTLTWTAIGVSAQARPQDVRLPMAPGYLGVLLDAMGEQAMPVELEPEFVEQIAWMDHRMAQAAIDGWNGQGTLIVLVDRLHVEGGKGVPWQLQQMTEAPVSSVLLADAQSPCYPGDRIWKDHPFDN